MKIRRIILACTIVSLLLLLSGWPGMERREVMADDPPPEASGAVNCAVIFPFVQGDSDNKINTFFSIAGEGISVPEDETPEVRFFFYNSDGVFQTEISNYFFYGQRTASTMWTFSLIADGEHNSFLPSGQTFTGWVIALTNLPYVEASCFVMDTATGAMSDAPAVVDYSIANVDPGTGAITRSDEFTPPDNPGNPNDPTNWYNLLSCQTEIDPSLHHTTLIFPVVVDNGVYDTTIVITNTMNAAGVGARTVWYSLYNMDGSLCDIWGENVAAGSAVHEMISKQASQFAEFEGTGWLMVTVPVPFAQGCSFFHYLGGSDYNSGFGATVDNNICGISADGAPQRLSEPTLERTSIVVPYVKTSPNATWTCVSLANTVRALDEYGSPRDVNAHFHLYGMDGYHVVDWEHAMSPGAVNEMAMVLITSSGIQMLPDGSAYAESLGDFEGWLLITVDAPCAEAVVSVGDWSGNTLSTTRAVIDNDIIGVWGLEIIRENPVPADSGDIWTMPYVQNSTQDVSGFDFTTTAITVNTRNKREFDDLGITEAKFKYTAWPTEGNQLGPTEVSVSLGATILPSHVQNLAELYAYPPYDPWHTDYTAHGREAGNAADSVGAVLFKYNLGIGSSGDGDTILVSEADLCESESHELPEGLCFYFEDFGRFSLSYLALPRAVRPTVQISETYEYSEGAGTLHITGTVTDMLKPVTEVTIDCVDYVAVAAPDNPPGGPYVSYFDVEFEFEMPQWEEDETSFAVNASDVTRALGTDVIVLKMVNGQIEIVHHENNADAMQPLEYYYVSPIPATEGMEVTFQAKAEDGTVYDSITSVMGQVPELDARVRIAGPIMLIKTYTDEPPSTFGLEPEVRSKVLFWHNDSCETLSAVTDPPCGWCSGDDDDKPHVRLNVADDEGNYNEAEDHSRDFLPGQGNPDGDGKREQQIKFDLNNGVVTPQKLQVVIELMTEKAKSSIKSVEVEIVTTGKVGQKTTKNPGYTGNIWYKDQPYFGESDFFLKTKEGEKTSKRTVKFDKNNGKCCKFDLYCHDTGGLAVLKLVYRDINGGPIKKLKPEIVRFPEDTDNDTLSDAWERKMVEKWNAMLPGPDGDDGPFCEEGNELKLFRRERDNELKDPDGVLTGFESHASGGDRLPAYVEYRGYILSKRVENGFVNELRRLTPVHKDLLVEVDNMKSQGGYTQLTTQEVLDILDRAAEPYMSQLSIHLHYLIDDFETTYDALGSQAAAKSYVEKWRDCNSTRPVRGNPGTWKYEYWNRTSVHLQFCDDYWDTSASGVTSEDFRGCLISVKQCRKMIETYSNSGIDLVKVTSATVAHELFHTISVGAYHNRDKYDIFEITYTGNNNNEFIANGRYETDPLKIGLVLDQNGQSPYDHDFNFRTADYNTIEKVRAAVDALTDFTASYKGNPPNETKNASSFSLEDIIVPINIGKGQPSNPITLKKYSYSIMYYKFHPEMAIRNSFDWGGIYDDIAHANISKVFEDYRKPSSNPS